MIELSVGTYVGKQTYDLLEATDGPIIWTTERIGTASKLSFTVVKKNVMFHEGDFVRCKVDGVSRFYGRIFRKEKSSDEKIGVICYDNLVSLKTKRSLTIEDPLKLGDVIRIIAADLQLTTGPLADTGFILEPKRYEVETCFDIITDCLSRTLLATGAVYNFYADGEGRLCLAAAEDMTASIALDSTMDGDQRLPTDYTYITSIEDAYNYVKLVQEDPASGGAAAYSSRDKAGIDRWGFLPYYEKVDSGLNQAQIEERVRYLLNYYCQVRRKLKIGAVSVPEVRAGSFVQLNIPDLGDIALFKKLLVNKCTHSLADAGSTMELEMIVENDSA